MQGLILGIDLCDDYCQAGYYNLQNNESDAIEFDEGNSYMIPTVLCKLKDSDDWDYGEAAFKSALFGKGISVDKLVTMCLKDGVATIDGVKYDCVTLTSVFLKKVLEKIKINLGSTTISQVVITTRNKNADAIHNIEAAAVMAGIPKEKLHFATHSEAYMYYVLAQKPDVYTNLVCMFDLTNDGMEYYELSITRGRKPQIAEAVCHELEEGFSLDILDTPQGRKIADKILCSCSERIIGKRVVTSVFLTGRAFDTDTWAENFINVACYKRRVFVGQGLFAQGAAYIACEHENGEKIHPYTCICSGRIANRVTIDADYFGQARQIIAAEAGSSFREAGIDADFILDDSRKVEFGISGVKMPWQKKMAVLLDGFPQRPNKTTRINVKIWFTEDNVMQTEITDLGFGQFYPSSGKNVRQEFRL